MKESALASGREDELKKRPVESGGGGLDGEDVAEYGRRPARLKAGYAVVLSLLLVVLGLVFPFSRPSPRREDTARQEAKGGMGQERRAAETEAQAVGEKLVPSTASLGAKGVGVSDGEGQGPGSPPKEKAPGRWIR